MMITDVDRVGTDIDQGNENAERRPESPEIVGINRPNLSCKRKPAMT